VCDFVVLLVCALETACGAAVALQGRQAAELFLAAFPCPRGKPGLWLRRAQLFGVNKPAATQVEPLAVANDATCSCQATRFLALAPQTRLHCMCLGSHQTCKPKHIFA
jgi:hypothetical protein